MKRIHGRNIFIVNLANVLQPIGPALFLERATASRFSALWIRVGRGEGRLGHWILASISVYPLQAAVMRIRKPEALGTKQ